MQGKALKLLLILQFAAMVAMPCECIFAQLTATDRAAASDCCRAGYCQLGVVAERPGTDKGTAELRPASHRYRFCPSCLLPDLAPPPTAPADDCAAASNFETAITAKLEPRSTFPSVIQQQLPLSSHHAVAHDLSLLRLRCALII